FNTGMVGYPETMTDPSYRGQILVCTYPLIGNYGVPGNEKEDNLYKHFESDAIHVRALIVADYSEGQDHWNSKRSLSDWMIEHKI
ncbi:MAG TPA: carbamoyl-phosphate synthase (glutamine-hydrolyzing) small subunit, partial [Ignavibacteriales bacterium]|nr:carbamoyl-phosphate synthase (glutamine-hydrolyzing) small subunit [Ignavibacteriales bacterium]